jgi:glycosyltransferase involved in cell wall biosynthesis
MKILLINKFLFPKAGAELSTFATAKLLKSKGHEVMLWGMDHPSNIELPHKEYFASNVDFNTSHNFKDNIRIGLNLLYSFEAKDKIKRLISMERPDVVHLNNFAHQISPSILHVFSGFKIPTVMTMRDYKLICPSYAMFFDNKPCEKCRGGRYHQCFVNKCTKNSRLKSLLNSFEMYLHHDILKIYDLIDLYVSPSMFLKNKCEEMGFKKKIVHLPNFVNMEEFSPRYDWSDDSIVYFGRISEEKGLKTLVKAVKGFPGVTLKLIGDGPFKNALDREIKDSDIKNVRFLGAMSGERLKDEIRKSMFVVVPSEWYENNPRSAIEGFALGKSVLGAKIGGIPELVRDNETGMTFESGNAPDLIQKIKYFIDNPDKVLAMGKNSRAFAEKELNSDRHYAGLMEIYKQAIEAYS